MYKRKWTPGLSTNPKSKIGRYRKSVAKARSYRKPAYTARRSLAIRGMESKYVDGYLDNTVVTELTANDTTWAGAELNPRQATAVYGCLPVPRQGTGYADRDGRKISSKWIRLRGKLQWASIDTLTAAQKQNFVRLVVVKDTRTNGVEVSAEDVLNPGTGSDGNAALTADAAVMCMTNPNGWGRYHIVYDKIFRIPPQITWNDSTDGAMNGYAIPFDIKVKTNCPMEFSDAAGAVGSVLDNSYHLIGAAGPNGTIDCSISYVARHAFVG